MKIITNEIVKRFEQYLYEEEKSDLFRQVAFSGFHVHNRCKYILMKSFVSLTMKSKQAWMKSSLCSDEIKSVLISAEGDFICVSRFHPRSGFIPSKDGFS